MDTAEITAALHAFCDQAAGETLPRFRANIDVINKAKNDFDPVTEADRQAEKAIRGEINRRFPDHSIVGEEIGTSENNSRYKWIIDPIDGTRAFVSGLPTWGTLIGLYCENAPLAGIMHQPFTGEKFFSDSSKSYFQRNDEPAISINASDVIAVDSATILTTSPSIFSDTDRKIFDLVETRCQLSRYGLDCYAYAMLAMGMVDIVMESDLQVYDIAALIPVIRDAGGIVSNWQGDDASKGGRVLACANAKLHTEVLEIISANESLSV